MNSLSMERLDDLHRIPNLSRIWIGTGLARIVHSTVGGGSETHFDPLN